MADIPDIHEEEVHHETRERHEKAGKEEDNGWATQVASQAV
jgi:hypothetical protein